ncbi:MAG: hypothetical protein CMH94_01880 [Oceanicaulis sp.]|nr:hypothetical protein [Oceanicaulis sp.]MBI74335.1 hypothetical protein [Oceanicaulis sp.]
MSCISILFLGLAALQAPAGVHPDLAVLAPYEGLWQSEDGARALHVEIAGETAARLRYGVWQGDAWYWQPAWRIEVSPHGGWPKGWQPHETRNDSPLELHDDTDPGIEWHRDSGAYGMGHIVEIDIWDEPQEGRFTWLRLHSRRNGTDRVGEGVWIAVTG